MTEGMGTSRMRGVARETLGGDLDGLRAVLRRAVDRMLRVANSAAADGDRVVLSRKAWAILSSELSGVDDLVREK